jgi:GT2 family glycosyltransferase
LYRDFSVLIVDNGSLDGSMSMVRRDFTDVRILESEWNRGYAGGCNYGIRHTESPFIVLLNNDTEVTPEWLGPMIRLMEEDPGVAAIQPKIRSVQDRTLFDYCGAAGGEIDIFGYPFARGRLFNYIEEDEGQYDHLPRDIFWASGAAILLRRSALQKIGLFEESFFAHMEEIDLCWRLILAGFRVCIEPKSLVFHQTGGTLAQERLAKMVFNHRNSLLTVLRNYSVGTLIWLFPIRLLLEVFTFGASLITGQWKRMLAVPAGLWGVPVHFRSVLHGNKHSQKIRTLTDHQMMKRMYAGSIALAFFLSIRKKRFKDLKMT